VLVRLRAGRALVLRLIDRTAKSYDLRQFNPDQTIELDADEVEAVQRIAGELI
jgi:hypothetical protein